MKTFWDAEEVNEITYGEGARHCHQYTTNQYSHLDIDEDEYNSGHSKYGLHTDTYGE